MSNTIDSSLFLSSYQAGQKTSSSNVLGKDDFLKILIAQLQNQDPTNPMQDREFIAQMAQFSTLEQMMNMNNTLQGFIDVQKQNTIIAYNQFIGREVTWHNIVESNEPGSKMIVEEGTGRVVSVEFKNDEVTLILEDGTKLDPGNISRINDDTSVVDGNSLLLASQLIGRTVTYQNGGDETGKGVVSSVSLKGGKTYYQLDDGNTMILSSQITKIE